MSRRANQDDRSILNIRQKDILLRFVESVYLVDEEYRSLSTQLVSRPFANLADISDARENAGKPHEIALCSLGDYLCESRLAASRRPVEDYVCETVGFYHSAKQLALAKYVILPDDFFKRRWPHPCSERFCLVPFHPYSPNTYQFTTDFGISLQTA